MLYSCHNDKARGFAESLGQSTYLLHKVVGQEEWFGFLRLIGHGISRCGLLHVSYSVAHCCALRMARTLYVRESKQETL